MSSWNLIPYTNHVTFGYLSLDTAYCSGLLYNDFVQFWIITIKKNLKSDTYHLTHDTYHLTLDTWHLDSMYKRWQQTEKLIIVFTLFINFEVTIISLMILDVVSMNNNIYDVFFIFHVLKLGKVCDTNTGHQSSTLHLELCHITIIV